MKRRIWIFVTIRTLANALVIGGIVFSFISFWPFLNLEVNYWWRNSVVGQEPIKPPDNGKKEIELPPLGVAPVDTSFGIIIEKIDVNAPVVQNVDPTNYNEYIAALSRGVAHARGTAFPGQITGDNNNAFLFAHSAINAWQAKRYNSVFYLLRKLEVGDRITTFYQGKRYDYIVYDKKTVEATDVRYLTEPSRKPILTLQTCDPPGSSLRRLIVTARLVQ